jgi:hypothetical protein
MAPVKAHVERPLSERMTGFEGVAKYVESEFFQWRSIKDVDTLKAALKKSLN